MSRELLAAGRVLVENQFNSVIGNRFTVVGHKMVPGQLIGIHNDSPEQARQRADRELSASLLCGPQFPE